MRRLVTIFSLLIVLAGCQDYLDKSPVTEQTEENFYRTYDDMFAAVVAAYEPLQRNWGGGIYMYMDIASDDAYGGGGSSTDGVEGHRTDRGEARSSDGPWSDFWTNGYAGIYKTNLFLEKIEASEITDEQKLQMSGEAYFLRAYYYLDLVRTFENIPLITKTLLTTEYEQPQAAPADVYAQIASDLKAAIAALEGVTYSSEQAGRATKYAAEALMARAYLFYSSVYGQEVMGDVTKAQVVGYLEDVIDPASGYGLVDNFEDLWGHSDNWQKNTKEGVFEVQFSNQGEGWQWNSATYDTGNKMSVFVGPRGTPDESEYYSAWSFEPVTNQLYDAYSDDDLRRDATIIDADLEIGVGSYTIGYQNTGYFNKKMAPLKRDVPTVGQEQLNFPYNYTSIRFSDVLLMAAELTVGSSEADGYYNQVRERAFGENYTPATGVTLDQIFKERRLELALEGQRFWDLLRRGVDYVDSAIAETAGEVPFNSGFNTESKGFWPIPNSEIALSNKALTQNAGFN